MTMKRCSLFLPTMLLATTLVALLAGTGSAAAPNWAAPNWNPDDVVGDWYGLFASGWDRTNVGEAALRVDSQERQQFKGKLAMGRLVFDIQGIVGADPPEPDRGESTPPQPDRQLFIGGTTPPEPDMPGARILVRGTIGLAEPPSPDTDPPSEIVADYLIVYSDGSMDMGSLELVPAVMPR